MYSKSCFVELSNDYGQTRLCLLLLLLSNHIVGRAKVPSTNFLNVKLACDSLVFEYAHEISVPPATPFRDMFIGILIQEVV